MQVYFIDNEDYFHRKHILTDQNGQYFKDNDERTIFFTRGVLETVRKLRWSPDIVHCHGWITALLPLYLKKAFQEDPLYMESKVVYSVYNDDFDVPLDKNFRKKILLEGISEEDVAILEKPNFVNLSKMAIDISDAVIFGSPEINLTLSKYISSLNKPVLNYTPPEEYIDAYSVFYDEILTERVNED